MEKISANSGHKPFKNIVKAARKQTSNTNTSGEERVLPFWGERGGEGGG